MQFVNTTYRENLLAYGISFLFILINALAIYLEFYYLNFLPVTLALVFLAFLSLDKLVLVIVFFTPLSIALSDIVPGLPFDMYLPTEPIMAGSMVLFVLKLIHEKTFDKRILGHPVSMAIFLHLFWMLITVVTSTMPLVSLKFLISRMWFLVAFYFLATQLFRKFGNVKRYIWAYIIPFVLVIIYSTVRHAGYGLNDQQAAHFVVQPFYNDHTSYGAALAFLIPVLTGFYFLERKKAGTAHTGIFFLILVFIAAMVLSYTRAAWVSIAGALAIWLLVKLRIRLLWLIIPGMVILALAWVHRSEIIIRLEQNRQVSSGDIKEHVQSISNVATDASNLERLNRWSCAYRMFLERPAFGWGPGTYMFQYAPFQLSYEKTEISTNAADLGNAHSEYIGPLAESGIPGSICFILIVLLTMATGIRVYSRSVRREHRIISISVLTGLTTYYIHGLLNNFLDTDKASALFWGFTAILVVMDVYHVRTDTTGNRCREW